MDHRRHLFELALPVVGLRISIPRSGGRIFGRLRAALRQVADLIRHHRESHPGFSGAGRFDRRVQGQDISLECDLVDDANDFRDLLARGR